MRGIKGILLILLLGFFIESYAVENFSCDDPPGYQLNVDVDIGVDYTPALEYTLHDCTGIALLGNDGIITVDVEVTSFSQDANFIIEETIEVPIQRNLHMDPGDILGSTDCKNKYNLK